MSAEEEGAELIGEADEAALDHVVEQQSARRMPPNEQIQVQQIQALETEQLLEEEEAESDADSLGDSRNNSRVARPFTYDTALASRHTYLGDVDDIEQRDRAVLEEGAMVRLPMVYLEGTVLFPDATLPLRVVQQHHRAAVQHAMSQTDAAYTLGVVYMKSRPTGIYAASVGTTAEIRQVRHLPDGSINVVARGRQRFKVHRPFLGVDGTPCAQVQIMEEDVLFPVPRAAFSAVAAVPSFEGGRVPRASSEPIDMNDSDDDVPARGNADTEDRDIRGQVARFLSQQGTLSNLLLQFDDNSSDEESNEVLPRWLRRNHPLRIDDTQQATASSEEVPQEQPCSSPSKRARITGDWGGASKAWAKDQSKMLCRAPCAAWPHWVYRMFDAYDLARRAADMWRQMVELPSMDDLVRNPGTLSYFIASKMPLPDATRQELLDMDSAVYRLRREIQLLECMDQIRCKFCKATIARRSDMLVMSTDGPVNAFVNEHGYVHETLTLRRARGLNLPGRPETEHSWFPGYAWTIAYCVCDTHMGWRFTAVKPDTNPRAFWGIRRCQIAAIQ